MLALGQTTPLEHPYFGLISSVNDQMLLTLRGWANLPVRKPLEKESRLSDTISTPTIHITLATMTANQNITKRETITTSSPSYSELKPLLEPSLWTLTDSHGQSINSIPENITYFNGDDNLESTRGARFQVNSINERLRVVDIAPCKTPKTLRDRHVKVLSLVRCHTGLDLET